MKIAFFGAPDFAALILEDLIKSHDVVVVVTAEDLPRGRGKKVRPTPVKKVAVDNNILVLQPKSLKGGEFKKAFSELSLDIAIVVAYGKIIPQSVLDIPPLGFVNVHASLLPRWRGAAPIHRAILSGDLESGVSIMKMDAGLDTGPVYSMAKAEISIEDTTGTLHDKLADLGSDELLKVLDSISNGEVKAIPQPLDGVTYARKIHKNMARIDWGLSCKEISLLVRGLNPYPCAKTEYMGDMWKIYKVDFKKESHSKELGEIVSTQDGIISVACSDGFVLIKELQRSGSKKMKTSEFLRGKNVEVGAKLC